MFRLSALCGVIAVAFLFIMPVSAQAAALKIVSLSPAVTGQIYDLGAGDMLVGVTSYCPQKGKPKQIVGNLIKLNFEKILLLKPDIVFLGKDANRKDDAARLKALGLSVEVIEGCESFDCMCSNLLKLGKLLGRESNARIVVEAAKAQVKSAGLRYRMKKPLKVFVQAGINPLVAAGANTFMGEYLKLLGCTNIFSDLGIKYPRINMEEVVKRNPDVIIIVQMDGTKGFDMWKNIKQVNAVKYSRLYNVDPNSICQPTPLKFAEGLKVVGELLNRP